MRTWSFERALSDKDLDTAMALIDEVTTLEAELHSYDAKFQAMEKAIIGLQQALETCKARRKGIASDAWEDGYACRKCEEQGLQTWDFNWWWDRDEFKRGEP